MNHKRIVSDVNICGGEPCVKNTRVPVRVVLSHLAAGETVDEILKNFPKLNREDIRACLEYASYLATEHIAQMSRAVLDENVSFEAGARLKVPSLIKL